MKWISLLLASLAILGAGCISPTATPSPSPTPTPTTTSYKDVLKDVNVVADQKVGSPLTVTGLARGNWYFEASFPVKLIDANGNGIVSAPAQAQGDWMTTDYVPFTVTLTFPQPATATGKLVLQKDNPSGLPENEDSLEIPVSF